MVEMAGRLRFSVCKVFMSKKFLIFLLLLAFAGIPLQSALANAAAPPSWAWFIFKDVDVEQAGIQLIGCETLACADPVLLHQHGQCQSDVCLEGSPLLSGYNSEFRCGQNKCISSAYPSHDGLYFKIILQTEEGVFTSDAKYQLPASYAEEAAWDIKVRNEALLITPTPKDEIPVIEDPLGKNLGKLFFSLGTELVVAALFFSMVSKLKFAELYPKLGMIFLINFATLPVVWLYFPSLGYFQHERARSFGAFILVASLIYTAIFFFVYRLETKRIWGFMAIFISMPLYAVCSLFFSFATSYGNIQVAGAGISASMIIVQAELFALAAETVMIYQYSRKTIPLKQSLILALAMNLASFLGGQFLF